jgi:hypothetical protein
MTVHFTRAALEDFSEIPAGCNITALGGHDFAFARAIGAPFSPLRGRR